MRVSKALFFHTKKKLDEIKYLFYASFMLRLKNRQQFFSDGSQKKIQSYRIGASEAK